MKLLETGRVDPAMETIAAYAKMVDSAALPNSLDLAATPYAVLRALFSGSKKSEDEINRQRTDEGLRFMRFLYTRAAEGNDIIENRKLFAGIDRYERAVHKVEGDYSSYLADLDRGRILRLRLPAVDGRSVVDVDGLTVANPRSFLLKEWARRDREHPPDRRGFGFLMTKFGEDRFILGVDPDRGIHLKGLGTRLNLKELEKRTAAAPPRGRHGMQATTPSLIIASSIRRGTAPRYSPRRFWTPSWPLETAGSSNPDNDVTVRARYSSIRSTVS